MSTDKPKRTRAEAARSNGAKSRGPKTPEGKAKSSRNSLKHGAYAQPVVLFHENPEDYETLRQAYFADLQPSSPLETTLVTEMVNAQWRIYRLQRNATAIIDWSVEESEHETNEQFNNLDDDARHAFAWQDSVEESPALETASRHEARLRRSHDRLFNNLLKLRAFKNGGNEPIATPAPAETAETHTPAQPQTEPPPSQTAAESTNPPFTPIRPIRIQPADTNAWPPYPYSQRPNPDANYRIHRAAA